MKLTKAQFYDAKQAVGIDNDDIDILFKAAEVKGMIEPDPEPAEEQSELQKSLEVYEADLKKADGNPGKVEGQKDMTAKEIYGFGIGELDTNSTDPQGRPPDERTEIPEDIDNLDAVGLTQDIVKALAPQLIPLIQKAFAPALGKIMKTQARQGAIIVGQARAIDDINKARKAGAGAAKQESKARPLPTGDLPIAGYTVIPDASERAKATANSAAPTKSAPDHFRDVIEKALSETRTTLATVNDHDLRREAENRIVALDNAFIASFTPGVNFADLAKAANVNL